MAQPPRYPFEDHIRTFVVRLRSLGIALDAIMPLFQAILKDLKKDVKSFVECHERKPEDNGTSKDLVLHIPTTEIGEFRRLTERLELIAVVNSLCPPTLLVSMINQYDALLGNLIRGIFHVHPNALKASAKNITFAELVQFGSIDIARNRIMEKEVEAVLRQSHSEHFTWLEKRLKMSLVKDFGVWPAFIEVTERRNLFVHTDGIVSSQYLNVCDEHKVSFGARPAVGDKLCVPPKYFRSAYLAVTEVGVKLGQAIWRKLVPSEIEKADTELNELCVQLISRKEYDLAIELLSFRNLISKKPSSAETSLLFEINRAQAYKWKQDDKGCQEVLSRIDFGPLAPKFQLAKAVLQDRFEDAANLMREIGDTSQILHYGYREWPLFKQFRQTPDFEKAYKEVFGESFEVTAPEPRCLEIPKECRGPEEDSPSGYLSIVDQPTKGPVPPDDPTAAN